MPLHFNSITNDCNNTQRLAYLLQKGIEKVDYIFVSKDQQYVLLLNNIYDEKTGETLGKFVYTIKILDKSLNIIDMDIIWENRCPTKLYFNKLLDGSSESNEYYEVYTLPEQQHLNVETVNRHIIDTPIIDTDRDVYISVFPFELSVFDDIFEFNSWAGFKTPIVAGPTDIKVAGFAETFIMPLSTSKSNAEDDEHCSLILGKVCSFREVEFAIGEEIISFILAQVETALGVVTTAMSRDVFDLSKFKNGCIVAMKADIKVNFATDKDYKKARA